MEKLYTVKEIAPQRLLGYGERMIRELIRTGELEYTDIRRQGRKKPSYRISESAIRAYIEKNKTIV